MRQTLLALGCPHVLITGTHENTKEVINSLYSPNGVVRADRWERLPAAITAPAAPWHRPLPACWPPG
jgi:hydroxymethylpyrimidine/phosphomethylpyrimidine kinase